MYQIILILWKLDINNSKASYWRFEDLGKKLSVNTNRFLDVTSSTEPIQAFLGASECSARNCRIISGISCSTLKNIQVSDDVENLIVRSPIKDLLDDIKVR